MADNRLVLTTKIIMNLLLDRIDKVVIEINGKFSAAEFRESASNSINHLQTKDFSNPALLNNIEEVAKRLEDANKINNNNYK